jgi:hypothetical protein
MEHIIFELRSDFPQEQDIVAGRVLMPEARRRLGREQGGLTELYSRIQDYQFFHLVC